ncbi:MAG: FCD domain-containing protein [Streptosporangiales bacterium]|nr:FCD domain-containing protein [Streptosporangiales bacterium]
MPQNTSGRPKVVTLAGRAEQVLREMIFAGELAPGVRVSADDAAEKLGMSPIPVREALRSLASRGLVDAIPQRGFRVRPADRDDFAETYQLRTLLDPFATRLAVPRMDATAIAAMDQALAALEHTMLTDDVASYDRDHHAFHFSIYDHGGSRWLLHVQGILWENSQRYQRLSAGIRGSAEQRVAEHRAIADACRVGDADAAATLVYEHLDRTRVVVFAALDAEQEAAPGLTAEEGR